MKTLFSKKNIKTLSILLIIDIIMVGCWTLYTQPDESMTIILLFIIPIVFLTNLVIAGIFYFIKMYYTPFLVINAFLSSFLVYLFFVQYIEINRRINMDSWEFFIDGVKYTISCDDINRDGSYYSIEYSPEPGLSIGGENERGIVFARNDTVYFTAVDSTIYFIYNNYLYKYKNINKIKVKKKY